MVQKPSSKKSLIKKTGSVVPDCVCSWKYCKSYQKAFRRLNYETFTGNIQVEFIEEDKASQVVKHAWDRHLRVGREAREAWNVSGTCTYVVARHHFTEAMIAEYLKEGDAWSWKVPLSEEKAKALLWSLDPADSVKKKSSDEVGYLKVPNVPKEEVKKIVKQFRGEVDESGHSEAAHLKASIHSIDSIAAQSLISVEESMELSSEFVIAPASETDRTNSMGENDSKSNIPASKFQTEADAMPKAKNHAPLAGNVPILRSVIQTKAGPAKPIAPFSQKVVTDSPAATSDAIELDVADKFVLGTEDKAASLGASNELVEHLKSELDKLKEWLEARVLPKESEERYDEASELQLERIKAAEMALEAEKFRHDLTKMRLENAERKIDEAAEAMATFLSAQKSLEEYRKSVTSLLERVENSSHVGTTHERDALVSLGSHLVPQKLVKIHNILLEALSNMEQLENENQIKDNRIIELEKAVQVLEADNAILRDSQPSEDIHGLEAQIEHLTLHNKSLTNILGAKDDIIAKLQKTEPLAAESVPATSIVVVDNKVDSSTGLRPIEDADITSTKPNDEVDVEDGATAFNFPSPTTLVVTGNTVLHPDTQQYVELSSDLSGDQADPNSRSFCNPTVKLSEEDVNVSQVIVEDPVSQSEVSPPISESNTEAVIDTHVFVKEESTPNGTVSEEISVGVAENNRAEKQKAVTTQAGDAAVECLVEEIAEMGSPEEQEMGALPGKAASIMKGEITLMSCSEITANTATTTSEAAVEEATLPEHEIDKTPSSIPEGEAMVAKSPTNAVQSVPLSGPQNTATTAEELVTKYNMSETPLTETKAEDTAVTTPEETVEVLLRSETATATNEGETQTNEKMFEAPRPEAKSDGTGTMTPEESNEVPPHSELTTATGEGETETKDDVLETLPTESKTEDTVIEKFAEVVLEVPPHSEPATETNEGETETKDDVLGTRPTETKTENTVIETLADAALPMETKAEGKVVETLTEEVFEVPPHPEPATATNESETATKDGVLEALPTEKKIEDTAVETSELIVEVPLHSEPATAGSEGETEAKDDVLETLPTEDLALNPSEIVEVNSPSGPSAVAYFVEAGTKDVNEDRPPAEPKADNTAAADSASEAETDSDPKMESGPSYAVAKQVLPRAKDDKGVKKKSGGTSSSRSKKKKKGGGDAADENGKGSDEKSQPEEEPGSPQQVGEEPRRKGLFFFFLRRRRRRHDDFALCLC